MDNGRELRFLFKLKRNGDFSVGFRLFKGIVSNIHVIRTYTAHLNLHETRLILV